MSCGTKVSATVTAPTVPANRSKQAVAMKLAAGAIGPRDCADNLIDLPPPRSLSYNAGEVASNKVD
jgi:hypothetical protein